MKTASFLTLLLLGLLSAVPAQARDTQKTYRFSLKGNAWTIRADYLQRKGAWVYFRGNVKATNKHGDKINADTAAVCLTPGQEKLTLSPVKQGTIVVP